MAKLDYADLYRMKWILGGLLGLLSLWNIFSLDLGLDWMVRGAAILMMAAVLWPPVAASLPAWFWRVQTPVIVVFVVSDFILAGGDFIPPLIRMVILLALLRTLQPRTRREDLQLVVLTLILVVVSGVLTLEISFALQLALYTPLVMLFLFVVNLSESFSPEDTVPDNAWKRFCWRRFLRDVRGLFDSRLIIFSGVLFSGMMLSASLLFISLPRFELGQTLPFLTMQARGTYTGFSEQITYGDIVSIMNDDSVAFRADVGPVRPRRSPYWRMLVLDEYTPEGFSVSESLRERGRSVSSNFVAAPAVLRQPRGGTPWTVYFEGGVSRFLPFPGSFGHVRFQSRHDVVVGDATGTAAMREAPGNVLFYQLTGLQHADVLPLHEADEPLIRALAGEASGGGKKAYPLTTLGLPGDAASLRVLDDAVAAVRGGDTEAMDAETFGRRAVALLQHGRGYSLRTDIPEGDGDILTRWLDSDVAGHCELFAGAFVLVARRAGFPARVVVGFHGGDWNGFENYFMVRNRHAHAWAEIFDPEQGWLHFEPTPAGLSGAIGQPSEEATAGGTQAQADRTWAAYMDSLRVIWYRRVVNFDREQQQQLVSGIGAVFQTVRDSTEATLRSAFSALREWFGGPWDLRHILILVRNIAIAVIVWVLFRVALRWVLTRARIRSGSARTRAKAGRFLRRLRAAGADRESGGPDSARVRAELRHIRYGPVVSWPEVDAVFRSARRAVRRAARV
ncbi:MAG: DUF3488 domain-containing protein [Opitutales bacterium]|nr:DUF3488 domain-containing protein [Opitutales bacterium]